MSTTEIIIVFSALMALIALVTIGIDWIGKPLKTKRFIPRMYRFDDEKLPVDAYGHPHLDAAPSDAIARGPAWVSPPGHQQPPPVVVATVPDPLTAAAAPPAPPLRPPTSTEPSAAPDPATQPEPAVIADQTTPASTSAFSDSLLEGDTGAVSAVDADAWLASGLVPNRSEAATADRPPTEAEPTSATAWVPGLALDAVVNDERPSLATKAERYWKATAAASEESHFDTDAIDRMAAGKAPRRRNPRSGRNESMQLTGLRRGSTRSDVRMSWPDSSVDPWAAS